jgi:DNA polymerase gamma 1
MHTSITGVPILNDVNNEKIFGKGICPPDKISRNQETVVIREREKYNLSLGNFYLPEYLKNINDYILLPNLISPNLAQFTEEIATELSEPWYSLLDEFEKLPLVCPVPEKFYKKTGWVKYPYDWASKSYGTPKCVAYPEETLLCFDCETMVTMGNHPVMGAAVSSKAFYVWLHPCLVDNNVEFSPGLIPLGTEKLIVGHNVAFDRSRIKESYYLDNPTCAFIDTMSLHNVCSGLTSEQKIVTKHLRKTIANNNPFYFPFKGSPASLVEVYTYHMMEIGHTVKDKELRDIFVKATDINQVRKNLGSLIKYNCLDTYYTMRMLPVIWGKYKVHTPSKVSFYGMLVIGSNSQLPVVDNWDEWLSSTEQMYYDINGQVKNTIIDMAHSLYRRWCEADLLGKTEILNDPSYGRLDWNVKAQEGTDLSKILPENLVDVQYTARKSKYELIPAWYIPIFRDGYDAKVSNKSVLTHYLLRTHWLGSPVFCNGKDKFCYYDSSNQIKKLPHKKGKDKNGEDRNVGGCLNKDFLELVDSGALTFEVEGGKDLYKLALKLSYWISTRARVKQQRVWGVKSKDGSSVTNVIVPQVIPHNTVTLRTGENLFLTIPDTDYNRIGTEIKTRIQAPKGKKFVYFDFDSQEYAIFALFGDHFTQRSRLKSSCGSSTGFIAFGGHKDNKSDPHYVLAFIANITRQVAKNVNYAVIYGGGMGTVTNTVHTGNRLMQRAEAVNVAEMILEKKKGKKLFDRNNPDCPITQFEGGCDSDSFNFMEKLIMTNRPATPMLGRIQSEALHWRNLSTPGQYKTNRINWTIQCSGTDMLATMITYSNYLFLKYTLNLYFLIMTNCCSCAMKIMLTKLRI